MTEFEWGGHLFTGHPLSGRVEYTSVSCPSVVLCSHPDPRYWVVFFKGMQCFCGRGEPQEVLNLFWGEMGRDIYSKLNEAERLFRESERAFEEWFLLKKKEYGIAVTKPRYRVPPLSLDNG